MEWDPPPAKFDMKKASKNRIPTTNTNPNTNTTTPTPTIPRE